MARSNADRMMEYRKRKRASGLVPVLVYVPEASAAEVRAFAAELQEDSPGAGEAAAKKNAGWLMANSEGPPKAALQVAARIVQEITAMGWPVGEVIGDESALTRRYAVGRGTFREAMRLLEHHGVVRMKRGIGGGLMVTEPSLDSTIYAARIYLEFRKIGPGEFLPVRRVLERMALARALERMDDAAGKRLKEAIEREEHQDKLEHHQFQRLNRLITELADDPAITLFMSILLDLTLDRSREETPRDADRRVRALHREIVQAMLARDKPLAMAALNDLHDFIEYLFGQNRGAKP